MIAQQKSLRAYRENATRTASPGSLVLMLFDGALRFLEAAARGFSETQFIRRQEQIHNNIMKAYAILGELKATLNFEQGGEIAPQLHGLYAFMQEQLLQANQHKAPEPIEVVQNLLGQIRDSWAEMLRQRVQAPLAAAAA